MKSSFSVDFVGVSECQKDRRIAFAQSAMLSGPTPHLSPSIPSLCNSELLNDDGELEIAGFERAIRKAVSAHTNKGSSFLFTAVIQTTHAFIC